MKDKNSPRTGIIYCEDDHKFNFYLDGYTATFMNSDYSEIKLDKKFLYGETYGSKNIAIHKGDNPISFSGATVLNTNAYLIAVENVLGTNWESFDSIEFIGGVLNNLFFCNALTCEPKDNGDILFHRNKAHKRWEFEIEDGCKCELIVSSWIKQHSGLTGISLSNNTVDMQLRFSEPQSLEDAFKLIWKVKNILSIMVGRANVTFDEIYLRHNNTRLSKMQVFMKEETKPVLKDIMRCITFYDLDKSIPALFKVVFDSKDAMPSYEIGFLPNSGKDFSLITNEKIRLICSSLECELSFLGNLNQPEKENLQELIQSVKSLVKEHRNGTRQLSNRTYELIFSNIRHWEMSAGDRFCALYHRYETEMEVLNQSGMSIGDNEIHALVKYRNDITHGSYRVLNEEIAATAYLLQGLFYCCVLDRIGVSRDKIRLLCCDKKILS